ncbi:uncharacterized protein LOC143027399 [Oratosquilla oratoria]|uniref:uncharacterized protein LOC143027399 n=1 Tax=Oratosquilla oratoria TaxID=337810 RepID=UPI003F75E294
MAVPGPPIDKPPPSLTEVKEAVSMLKGGKATGICNISVELLKDGGEATGCIRYCLLSGIPVSFPLTKKKGLIAPIWEGERDRQDCNNYRDITLNVPGNVLAHLLLVRVYSYLLKFQGPKQPGSRQINQQLIEP